jgi:hypothetical protein
MNKMENPDRGLGKALNKENRVTNIGPSRWKEEWKKKQNINRADSNSRIGGSE